MKMVLKIFQETIFHVFFKIFYVFMKKLQKGWSYYEISKRFAGIYETA